MYWSEKRDSCVVALLIACIVSTARADDPFPGPTADPYTEHQSLLHYIDADGVDHPVTTADDWAIRRQHILEGMQRAMGPMPSRENLPDFDIEGIEVFEHD